VTVCASISFRGRRTLVGNSVRRVGSSFLPRRHCRTEPLLEPYRRILRRPEASHPSLAFVGSTGARTGRRGAFKLADAASRIGGGSLACEVCYRLEAALEAVPDDGNFNCSRGCGPRSHHCPPCSVEKLHRLMPCTEGACAALQQPSARFVQCRNGASWMRRPNLRYCSSS
jgi:hypothetical protein